ncbi:unnamed protein product [Cyprideis torosa]|uniref:Phosphorylase b kinase regulatory subunit n=1 Tax=Cyprideis torosa TaxID=163714 RepID=A0A7R8WS96_9CRUS|nr:unnamed protein product [Cyprideis torosa]CAG0907513.1 unnamed protein product [Cyprideis torosa]
MLGKRVEDLAKSVTDLLVRQKQVTVGMPPSNERTITAPLPHHELRQLIHTAYGDDESSAMLTQELLLYLGMFIRTDPQLFTEVLRLRVVLIIQVMAQELARGLGIPAEDGSDKLLDLSPYDMKSLLFHIMSGKEFSVGSRKGKAGNISIASRLGKVSKKSDVDRLFAGDSSTTGEGGDTGEEIGRQQQGQWLRRRRLDGALNRVPTGFYSNMWSLLGKCQGLSIEGRVLPPTLTREMTAGELKFALHVETVLNTIPQPEYRQLMVEAMMVLMILVDYKVRGWSITR